MAVSDSATSIGATNFDQIKGIIYRAVNLDLWHFGKGIYR